MTPEKRAEREDQIAKAAYALLEERGYGGVSMLMIARQAHASNETLYRWYGDKAGLFRALVARNAAEVTETLTAGLAQDAPFAETMERFGTQLLTLLLGDRAVALNRAAAADATGALGAALSAAGRESVLPILAKLLERERAAGRLAFDDATDSVTDSAQLYLALLIGDRQVRRIIGRTGAPSPAEARRLSARALARYLQLSAPGRSGPRA